MSDKDVLTTCQSCGYVDLCRHYGEGDPPALICMACAKQQAERVTRMVQEAAEQMKRLG